MKRVLSEELFRIAERMIPGGVNSPVRSFQAVDTFPSFIERGEGSRLWDVDGNAYIDYVLSWGAAVLGHAHPEVVASVCAAAQKGLGFGAATPGESQLAERILSAFPAMDLIRFVSSGTEACMTAIRLARAHTRRDKFIKFSGNYHGHADTLLAAAGSGLATFSIPSSSGVPAPCVEGTLIAPFNDLAAVKALFREHSNAIAAVIVEPFVGNAGFIRPAEGFLEGLRELCSEEKAVLIFDEVITGFRLCWGGAQTLFHIDPDLTSLGKIIGGGLALAAFGGKAEIMSHLAPLGSVYQAGTLSGNPVAVASGLKTLELLGKGDSYARLTQNMRKLVSGIADSAKECDVAVQVDGEGGMFGLFFSDAPVTSFESAKKSDLMLFKKFFKGVFEKGIYWAPSLFEAGFLSLAHSEHDIVKTLEVIQATLRDVKKK